MKTAEYYQARAKLIELYTKTSLASPSPDHSMTDAIVLDAISCVKDTTTRIKVYNDYIYRIKKIGPKIESSDIYMDYVNKAAQVEYPEELLYLTTDSDFRIETLETGLRAMITLKEGEIRKVVTFNNLLDIDERTSIVEWMENLVPGSSVMFCKFEALSMYQSVHPIRDKHKERSFKYIEIEKLNQYELARLISNFFYSGDPLTRDNVSAVESLEADLSVHPSWAAFKSYVQAVGSIHQFDLGIATQVFEVITAATSKDKAYSVPDLAVEF